MTDSLWDPPKDRGPSVLDGLVVTPPDQETLARIERTEQEEDQMHFGQALEALKAGKRVARIGWNGKGMWLVLVSGWSAHAAVAHENRTRTALRLLPWIGMKTADNSFVPWLASQTDLLAEDWVEVA